MSTENSFLGVFPPPPTPLAAWSRHLVGGPPGFISDERQKRRQERLLLGITVSDSDSDSVTVSSRQSQVATSPAASASEPLPPLPASMAVETQPTDEDGAETPMPQDTIEGGSQLHEEWPQGRAERDTQEDADDESDISDSLVVARMLKVTAPRPAAVVQPVVVQDPLPTPAPATAPLPLRAASPPPSPKLPVETTTSPATPSCPPEPTRSFKIRLSATSNELRTQTPPVASTSTSTFRHPSPPSSPEVTALRVILKIPQRMRAPQASTSASPVPPPPPPSDVNRSRSYAPTTCHHDKNRTTRPKMKCTNASCTALWCDRCLEKHYAELAIVFVPNGNILCPVCRDVCTCARCRRIRGGGPGYIRKERQAPADDDLPKPSHKKRERKIRRPYVGQEQEEDDDDDGTEDGRIVTFLLSRKKDRLLARGEQKGEGSECSEEDDSEDDTDDERVMRLPALDDLPIQMPERPAPSPTVWNEGPKRKRRRTLGDEEEEDNDEEMSAEKEAEVKAVFEELIVDKTTYATSPLVLASPDVLFDDLPLFDPMLGSFADFDPIPPFHSPQLAAVEDDDDAMGDIAEEVLETLPIRAIAPMLEEVQASFEYYPAGHVFDVSTAPVYTYSPPCQLPTPDMLSAPGSPSSSSTLVHPNPRPCPQPVATPFHAFQVALLPTLAHNNPTLTAAPLISRIPSPRFNYHPRSTETFDHPEAISTVLDEANAYAYKRTSHPAFAIPRTIPHSAPNTQAPTPAASPRSHSPSTSVSQPSASQKQVESRRAELFRLTDAELGSALRRVLEREGGGGSQGSSSGASVAPKRGGREWDASLEGPVSLAWNGQ